jgi:hypothetical protein
MQNYPMYMAADHEQKAASAAFDNVMSHIHGPNYMTLGEDEAKPPAGFGTAAFTV